MTQINWETRLFVALFHVSKSIKSGGDLFTVRNSKKKADIAFEYSGDPDFEWKSFPRVAAIVDRNRKGRISVFGQIDDVPVGELNPGIGIIKTVLYYTVLQVVPKEENLPFIHFVEKVLVGKEFHSVPKSVSKEINSMLNVQKKRNNLPAKTFIFPADDDEATSVSSRKIRRPSSLDNYVLTTIKKKDG